MAKPKSIQSRITWINISLVAIIGILGLFSLFSLQNLRQALVNLISTNYNSIERLAVMESCLKEQRQDILLLLYHSENAEAQTDFQTQCNTFASAWQAEYDTIVLPQEMEMILEINTSYEDFCHTLDLMHQNQTTLALLQDQKTFYQDTVLPSYKKVLQAIEQLRSSNETALFGRQDEASAIVHRAIFMLCFLFLLAAVIAFIFFRSATQKLFRPIYEITQNLRSMRQGSLNQKATVHNTDEIGMLCSEFNQMTQRLSAFEQSTLGSLMEERNKTYYIVRAITDPLLILDHDYHVTLINRSFEALFSTTKKEAQGRHFLELLSGPRFSSFSQIHYQSNQTWKKILEVSGPNQSQFFHVTVTPVFTPAGEKSFVILAFRDVTESQHLEKLRTDFIATISHEFKTPLTSILMGAGLLENPKIGPVNAEQKKILATMREDGEQLNDLVGSLLTLSRMESSQVLYQFSSISLDDCIQKCVHAFLPRAQRAGVQLKTELFPHLSPVWADGEKILWVLNNLLSNALKYTGEEDKIRIQTCPGEGDVALVLVEDTGPGIPPEFQTKIFEKYVQVPGCDLEARGTGLGLAVAKEIISAHHGRIWCESGLSSGSRFYFTLPFANEGGTHETSTDY
ncbi:MAG TPA: PAS domain-containing protein [Firmicutes bacterium]|nr:PAS domain-containing protein [Bacillota bacterium]